ncbi:DUF4123 domain-containing protein [Robbsia andropogonis]|uniref:DUF4123 domain-containing protein n=1 Tax=Robbsia andropogonis TaxID=28092 RepID=UPI000AF217DA|nr:DUF4123 domain-containing protein [Robbsia andropogonis]
MSDPENLKKQIRAAIQKQLARMEDARLLIVVDPAASPLESLDAEPSFRGLSSSSILVQHDLFPSSDCPYLIELDIEIPEVRTLLERSINTVLSDRTADRMARGAGQRIGGWIVTQETPEALAAYWGNLILQRDERERATLLRFYDNRALALLWPMLTMRQRQGLLGPVTTWLSLDAVGDLTTYEVSEPSMAGMSIAAAQWPAIRRHGLVNKALARFAFDGGTVRPVSVDTAIAAAERADVLELEDAADAALFVSHALIWHPRFYEHPAVERALGEVGPETFYAEAISVLSDTEIEDIKGGRWLEAQRRNTVEERDGQQRVIGSVKT